ncbi:MAG: PIN domain-containing protein [Betaproteobacteria bacterium]|nr:PIN domain-containing protein [Betaproteobacteria bacterium]MBI2960989.1 PIN domain-containing protein [Betaproteobacteria bacterium]
MIWMLDTNIVVYFANRKPGYERIARRMSGRSPGEVRISAITLAELRFGIENGDFRRDNEAALDELLGIIQADDFPFGAAGDFGKIRCALLSDGKPIGPYDLLIAAHARHVGAVLVTNNEREFRRVPRLAVQNWLKP